jgi:NTE family protein
MDILRKVILNLFLFGIMGHTIAQDSIVVYTKRAFKGDRPKIGLVLSGGGAKGIAHVGFLRVMEKAGIHPDYIAGTSMGSLVGALYAIGFSVDSIESLLHKQNWNEILSNKIDYRRLNMEEKKDYGEYLAEFPFYGWKPGLPSGAIKGQELELLFEKLTISVASDSSFDQFYIPYRAVATDLLTGSAYVFSEGPLALAMRSSMSIPTIMQPVNYKGMMLVDGGLVENFPVSVAKDMGADIIIGVYTGGQLLPEEDLTSLIAILKQSSLMGGILDAKKQRKNVDIYIEPYLNDMSAADFNSADEFYKRGYEAAMKKLPDLEALAKYMNQFNPSYKERPKLSDSTYITEVDYSKIKEKKYRRLAEKVLSPDLETYLHVADIKENVDRLYGTRLFRKVGYHFTKADSSSGVKLVYDVVQREPKHLDLAIQYRNESKIGLIVNANFRNVVFPMSKLDLKFKISEYPAARIRYFSYMGYSTKIGSSVSYNLYTSRVPIYEQHSLIANYTRWMNNISGDFSFYPSINSSINLLARYETVNYKKDIDVENAEITNLKSSSWFMGLSFEINTFDTKYFTSDGIRLKVLAEANADSKEEFFIDTSKVDNSNDWDVSYSTPIASFIQLSLSFDAYKSLSEKWVLSSELFSIATSLPYVELVQSYLVGGMFPGDPNQIPFWGLPENSVFMNNGIVFRLGFRYEFYKNLFIQAKINGMFVADDISDILDDSPNGEFSYIGNLDNYTLGTGLEISYNSLIGPISVGAAFNDLYGGVWSHVRIGFKF